MSAQTLLFVSFTTVVAGPHAARPKQALTAARNAERLKPTILRPCASVRNGSKPDTGARKSADRQTKRPGALASTGPFIV
jgi:hypothetical protein